VLLIERGRIDEAGQRLHYFSVPGGKIEPGETPEAAVGRELLEETGLLVQPNKLLAKQNFENGDSNLYYLCDYISGSLALHPSIEEKQLASNRSEPRWVLYKELTQLSFLYEPVRKLIIKAFKNDAPKKLLTIK
jgi:mutator protein MutT